MDMAVGIIIGGAFTSIVKSLTDDIINPLIKLITGSGAEVPGLTIPVPGTENGIDFSSFISAVINFLIVALVVFILIKAVNAVENASKKVFTNDKGEIVEEPVLICPLCLEEVNKGATRCCHCAGEITPIEKN